MSIPDMYAANVPLPMLHLETEVSPICDHTTRIYLLPNANRFQCRNIPEPASEAARLEQPVEMVEI